MKIIKYQLMREINRGTDEKPNLEQCFYPCEVRCGEDSFESNLAIAQKEAYNGEVTVEEIEDPITEPTQLDRVEAQVTYTAMCTDTLLDVSWEE